MKFTIALYVVVASLLTYGCVRPWMLTHEPKPYDWCAGKIKVCEKRSPRDKCEGANMRCVDRIEDIFR